MSHPTINNNAYKITQHGDYNYSLASKGEYKTLLYLSILKTDLLSTALSTILIQLTGQSSDADFGVLGELKAHNYFATVLRSHFFLGIPDALC